MKILKRILIVLAILLLVVAAIGLMLPSQVRVERSITINRPQEMIFDYINHIQNWNSWSPWYELDTTASYTFSGPSSGKGAMINWVSTNKNVGTGSMTYTEVNAPSRIVQDLNFMEEGIATGIYVFSPDGAGSKITWSLEFDTGFNPLLRIIGKFMDGMVGKDFDRGLNKLKTIMEAIPVPEIQPEIQIPDTIPV